jgi:colanic acid biosynthesis protein WcaH
VTGVIHELVEEDFARLDIPDFGLSEEDYGRALGHLVQANVDVIIYTEGGDVPLGYRKDVPLQDKFWVFGGRMKRGETVNDAGARALRRELGLTAATERLTLDHIYNVMWAARTAPPGRHGFQTLLIVMRYQCTDEEARTVTAADETHEWLRWHTPAELHELQASGSELVHPFLPVVLAKAGLC